MLRIILAALHLLALGIGLGAVLGRASALREPVSEDSVKRAFRSDSLWGVSALLWLSTGVWRLFGEVEKSLSYYLENHIFLGKLGVFVVVLLLEILPMVTLVRWRLALRRSRAVENVVLPDAARRIANISTLEAVLVVVMVVLAVSMARGYGVSP